MGVGRRLWRGLIQAGNYHRWAGNDIRIQRHLSNVPRGTSLGPLQLQIRFVPRGTNPLSNKRSKEPGRLLAEPQFSRNRLTSEGDEAACQFLGGRVPGQ